MIIPIQNPLQIILNFLKNILSENSRFPLVTEWTSVFTIARAQHARSFHFVYEFKLPQIIQIVHRISKAN